MARSANTTTITIITTTPMNDGIYLERLSNFARMLRAQGLAVGPKETADAADILSWLGFEDREQVKTALRTVYAKSHSEQLIFDKSFDTYFVSEETRQRLQKEIEKQQEELDKAREKAERDLQVNGKPLELDQTQKDAYAAMPEERQERLRKLLKRYEGGMEREPEKFNEFIRSVFNRSIMEQQMMMEDAAFESSELDPELGLLFKDISQFKDNEIPKAIAYIETIAQQINSELTSKAKESGRSRKLDFRKTIRKSLSTGGVLYNLQFKKKRLRRRSLVLLCDVSGSMIQFSEFALRFIQSLNNVSQSSRVFLFSERLYEADAFSLQNMDLFRNYVRDLGIYGKGTRLGEALGELCTGKPPVLSDASTLIILSDTKTADLPGAFAALVEAKRQAGKVIWLNPIPESKWKYLNSVQIMSTVCTMVSCSTLSSLAAACRKLIQK